MLSKLKYRDIKKLIIYMIAIPIAYGFVYIKHLNNKNENESLTIQYDKLNLDNPYEFINSFIAIDSENKTYQTLLEIKQIFDNNFPDVTNEQKMLFQIYYDASLSGKHPNLYKKLKLLEKSLTTLDLYIKENSDSYDFRIARININLNLPRFFRNYNHIRDDLYYLVEGYKSNRAFDTMYGAKVLEKTDFKYLDKELKKYNIEI